MRKPLLYVPTDQFQHLLTTINEELDIYLSIPEEAVRTSLLCTLRRWRPTATISWTHHEPRRIQASDREHPPSGSRR